jgi:hypothetical protein
MEMEVEMERERGVAKSNQNLAALAKGVIASEIRSSSL